MKFSFSTKNVPCTSFFDMCCKAHEYEFSGFEIYDAEKEMREHKDSIFKTENTSGARRKLVNRGIEIPAICYPGFVTEEDCSTDFLLKYIDFAADAHIPFVIIKLYDKSGAEGICRILGPVLKKAEKSDVMLLIETEGIYANTENVIDIINKSESVALGACWNIRQTYFYAKESAQKTIQTLGAYIKYVRLGDRKENKDVLIGDGDLPAEEFIFALRSLDYNGFICADTNDETDDFDIVLTHFSCYLSNNFESGSHDEPVFYNRSKTGTFVWPKYEVINKTFSEVLDTLVKKYPDQYAFKYTALDYTRTYSQFRDDVDRTAASLISIGVKSGYHVAVWATNIPQWFIAFFATVKIGAVLVTVNTAYKEHEAEYLLRQSDTHTLIMIENCRDSDYKNIMQRLCPETEKNVPGEPLYCKKLPFLRNIVTVGFEMKGCLTWEDMIEKGRSVPMAEVKRRAALVKPSDVCNMQYTSGTTGFPKGVMLTHSNIINNGKIIGDRMDLSTADRMMVQVPMFHCFGMVLTMTSVMTHGGTLYPLPYFSPKSSLACINSEHITCFNGVPTMFIAMFAHEDFKTTDFSYMRTGIMAGSNCPAELMKRAADLMNMKEIVSVYGQTESSPGCTMGEVNEDLYHRTETVGSAFPGVECKIIDPETGEELHDGENGEFVARGFNIMKGYYKMPHETANTVDKDGWLHTGDICCRTSDGYYKVTGRLKDMIIRGGENIYPREIEEFYLTSKKIKDVQVIGVPDEKYGEEACAWIILKDGESSDENEMREYGNSFMARHKVPKYFIFAESFPMNAAGKILKYKMKEETIEKLGL